jgi:putative spermidine/putrescine transport system permease protein
MSAAAARRGPRARLRLWFLAAPLAFIAAFFVVPLLLLLAVSFTEGYPLDALASLASYRQLFVDAFYRSYLTTTLWFGVVVTACCLVVGYPLAYFLVRQANRSYSLLLVIVVSPLLVSVVARTVGWTIMLGNEGVVNRVLLTVGIVERPIQMLFTPMAAVIGMVHVLLPFMVLSLASVLSGLDRSLEEAASALGADRLRVFWRVTFPLSLRGVAVGCLLVFLLAVGAFVTPVLLGGGKIRLMAPMIYDQIINVVDWSLGSAMSIMLMLGGVAVLMTVPLAGRAARLRARR